MPQRHGFTQADGQYLSRTHTPRSSHCLLDKNVRALYASVSLWQERETSVLSVPLWQERETPVLSVSLWQERETSVLSVPLWQEKETSVLSVPSMKRLLIVKLHVNARVGMWESALWISTFPHAVVVDATRRLRRAIRRSRAAFYSRSWGGPHDHGASCATRGGRRHLRDGSHERPQHRTRSPPFSWLLAWSAYAAARCAALKTA